MIKLSIITPTYNCLNLLKNNIASIKGQKYKPIEHIIIDNMSDDGTEQLVNEYKRSSLYPIIYIREHDKGVYNAMNKGIKAAGGEWLHFLNSDDTYIGNDVLEKVFSYDDGNYDILCGDIFYGKDLNNCVYWKSFFNEKMNEYKFMHQGTFIKKSFFNQNGLYNEKYKIVADKIFAAKYYPKAKYFLLNMPVAFRASGGLSDKVNLNLIYEFLIANIFYLKTPLKFKILNVIGTLSRIKEINKNNKSR